MLGHGNIYPAGGEEPGPRSIVSSRRGWRAAHEAGNLVLCNGGDRRHFSGYADDIRVGDIVCYPGHVAIYFGNGLIVHEPNPNRFAEYGSMYVLDILTVRRFY